MPDDDVNAEFEALTDSLSLDEDAEGEFIDVTTLDLQALLTFRETIANQLAAMGELLNVKTQQARDLHSMRTAAVVEINKRAQKQ